MPLEEFWAGFRPRWKKPTGSAQSFEAHLTADRPLSVVLSRLNSAEGMSAIFGSEFAGKFVRGGQFSYLTAAGNSMAGAFSSINLPRSMEMATEEYGLLSLSFVDLGEGCLITIKASKITEDGDAWLTAVDELAERISN